MNGTFTFQFIAIICVTILNLFMWVPKLISTGDVTLTLLGLFMTAINIWFVIIVMEPTININSNKNE